MTRRNTTPRSCFISLFLLLLCAPTVPLTGQEFAWVRHGASDTYGRSSNVITDGAGHVYVAGSFNGTMTLDGQHFKTEKSTESFIAKYREDGTLAWIRLSPWPVTESIHYIVLDHSTMHLYAAGFRSQNPENGDPSGTFLCKLDTAGTRLWEFMIDGNGGVESPELVVPPGGGVIIEGSTLHGATVQGKTYGQGYYIASVSAEGTVQWFHAAQQDTDPFHNYGVSTTMDRDGNIYVTGSIQGSSVTLDAQNILHSDSLNRIFIIKYDAAGNVLWVKQNEEWEDAHPEWISIDENGRILLTGWCDYGVQFDSLFLHSEFENEIFVVCFDLDGNPLDGMIAGGPGFDAGHGITGAPDGGFWITGTADAGARFGANVLSQDALFVARYTQDLQCTDLITAYQADRTAALFSNAITRAENGALYISGIMEGPCVFPPHYPRGGTGRAFFLARLDPPELTSVSGLPAANADFQLCHNYPNPFSPKTEIIFHILSDGNVRLAVHDFTGRRIALLVDTHLQAGRHQHSFDGTLLPAGVYLCRLDWQGRSVTRTMTLSR